MSRPTRTVDEASWDAFAAQHALGDVVTGRVVAVVPFGAFVRVDGVDGLVPRASWPSPAAEDAQVEVRIVALDPGQRRVAFEPA